MGDEDYFDSKYKNAQEIQGEIGLVRNHVHLKLFKTK
jgi:hypothetical protein